MTSFYILLFCFGDQHLIFGDHFVPDGRQKATKEKIELGTLLITVMACSLFILHPEIILGFAVFVVSLLKRARSLTLNLEY